MAASRFFPCGVCSADMDGRTHKGDHERQKARKSHKWAYRRDLSTVQMFYNCINDRSQQTLLKIYQSNVYRTNSHGERIRQQSSAKTAHFSIVNYTKFLFCTIEKSICRCLFYYIPYISLYYYI